MIRYDQRGNGLLGFIILVALIWGAVSLFGGDENSSSYSPNINGSYYESNLDSFDEEYPVGFEGTDVMEACNSSTGNCYDLEIDSDGENIERINFPNGGYRDVYYSDCDGGYCIVEDEDGNEWELSY